MGGICNINNGRLKKCKNTFGGVKSVFIAPFKKLLRSDYTVSGVEITAFPVTFIYEFVTTGGVGFTQSENNNDGGKFQDISLTLNFHSVNAFDNSRFQKMLNRDYFMVILDNNGNYFLAGLRNGLSCDSLKMGSNNIYNISFTGQEIDKAFFCNGIMNSSLVIVDVIDYILQNNDNYVLQTTEYILQ